MLRQWIAALSRSQKVLWQSKKVKKTSINKGRNRRLLALSLLEVAIIFRKRILRLPVLAFRRWCFRSYRLSTPDSSDSLSSWHSVFIGLLAFFFILKLCQRTFFWVVYENSSLKTQYWQACWVVLKNKRESDDRYQQKTPVFIGWNACQRTFC